MAINLMNLLKDQMSDSLVNTLAGTIGENSTAAKSGINAILPTLLGGMANKASTMDGAASLLNMVKDGGFDGSMLGKLSNVFGGGAASDELRNTGSSMLSSLFGNKQNSILDTIASVSGMNRGSSSSLMSMMAPMVMSMIGKQVMGNNLNASGLMNLMQGQKSHIASALPAGMGNVLGFANAAQEKVVAAATSTTTKTTQRKAPTPAPEEGGGFPWKWIVGALGLALLGYFGMQNMGGGTETVNTTTESVSNAAGQAADAVTSSAGSATAAASGAVETATEAAGTAVAGAVTEIKDAAGLTMDAAGNLVDKAGNIVRKAGTFTKDASGKIIDQVEGVASKASELAAFSMNDAGDLVDGSGKVVYKKGEFTEKDGVYYDKNGNKIGQFLKKVGAAIAGAAGKTADAFKNTFGGMFKDKSKKGSSHTLSAMTWKDNSHKLAGYSQEEIKGLVAALKANPDAKIEVQASAAEGGKKLAKMRAQVVRDIMVSLGGLPDSQISVKGMGDATDKVEIVVK